ncbi:HNH endonuclease family protein [Luedemannella helvata]|uniref:HNH endonuclease family protein n=1 Tax=Luedemannella helvata TaxID=349315 RepID=A0ABP4W6U2_9ACTN
MRSPLRVILASVVCGLLLTAGSCDVETPTPAQNNNNGGGGGGNVTKPAPGGGAARGMLTQLKVAEWHSMSGYSRDRFPHWTSQGGGCDTREAVLKRDGKNVKTASDCKVTEGSWHSVYDGKDFSVARDLDIDHVVPLAAAWRAGAWEWTDDERSDFANDMERPQLLAVSASSNRSKGDQDPSTWKPPAQDYWCQYATDWVTVKSYWKLTITAKEKSALEDMLATC